MLAGLRRRLRLRPRAPPTEPSGAQRPARPCRLFVGANWKCALADVAQADALVDAVRVGWAEGKPTLADVELCLCPPHVLLGRVVERAGAHVRVGAQNVHESVAPLAPGTGVTTAALLRAVGCEWVVLGHSDRRNTYGETDALIADKAHDCLGAGLAINLTVGETRAQRDAGVAIGTVVAQVSAVAARVPEGAWSRVVIAYEPVWAVGAGATPCTPDETQRVHAEIRAWLRAHVGDDAARACRIVYTGSVTEANAESYARLSEVDGFVVGRAGLDAAALLSICQTLVRCKALNA
ncbi:hypothetical protein KFE25_004266 [Diacronema lutheri]|uniref:Triosephosphate isomerase n=1 Tax=Diacronema lutheri TaxID=2081491 RepID=A0A8J6C1L5_DIALT|nr:hypothetical protein KFE25_004266 [Diacronema lutheri]